MRGWKKRLLCTMLAGVTVLSGCSAGGSGASGSSAGESSGEQTTAEAAKDIVVWTGQRADAAYRDELLKMCIRDRPGRRQNVTEIGRPK